MNKFRSSIIKKSQSFRDKKLSNISKFLIKIKIPPNIITLLSLIFGILSAYFLFNDYKLFLIFLTLHFLSDSLDGVIARNSKNVTRLGEYLDHIFDRIVTIAFLISVYNFTKDYYILIVLMVFVFTQSIHIITKFEYPIIFSRTAMLIILTFYPLHTVIITNLSFLTVGVLSLYSGILQMNYFFANNYKKLR